MSLSITNNLANTTIGPGQLSTANITLALNNPSTYISSLTGTGDKITVVVTSISVTTSPRNTNSPFDNNIIFTDTTYVVPTSIQTIIGSSSGSTFFGTSANVLSCAEGPFTRTYTIGLSSTGLSAVSGGTYAPFTLSSATETYSYTITAVDVNFQQDLCETSYRGYLYARDWGYI